MQKYRRIYVSLNVLEHTESRQNHYTKCHTRKLRFEYKDYFMFLYKHCKSQQVNFISSFLHLLCSGFYPWLNSWDIANMVFKTNQSINQSGFCRSMVKMLPMGEFMDEFFNVAEMFNPLKLTDGEIGLFTSTLIICPGTITTAILFWL